MAGLDQEKVFIREAVAGLEDYLISDSLYGGLALPPAGIRTAALSRLTLGNLLFVQICLDVGIQGDSPFRTELVRLADRIFAAHQRWPANWDRKVSQEFPVRLKSWEAFLSAYWNDRPAQAKMYPAHVRERVILHLLALEGKGLAQEQQAHLNQLDKRLKIDLDPVDFIWESDLKGGFPADIYWYLYGRLRLR